MDVDRLVIFHHIPKAAGTSLLSLLRQNYPDGALLELYGRGGPPPPANPAGFTRLFEEIGPEDWSKVRCIAGHSANFAIPVLEQPFELFSLIRDPVDRVISLFHYLRERPEWDGVGGVAGSLIRDNDWSLADVLTRFEGELPIEEGDHQVFANFFNGQTRAILSVHFPVDRRIPMEGRPAVHTEFEPLLDRVLTDHYVLGPADRYADSVKRFASEFGWKHTPVTHVNATAGRPAAADLPSELVELIRNSNAVDQELYERASRELDEALISANGGAKAARPRAKAAAKRATSKGPAAPAKDAAAAPAKDAAATPKRTKAAPKRASASAAARPSSPRKRSANVSAVSDTGASSTVVAETPDRPQDILLTGQPATLDYMEPAELLDKILAEALPFATEIQDRWVDRQVECTELRLLTEVYQGEEIYMHCWLARPLDETGALAPLLVIPGGRGQIAQRDEPMWIAGTTRTVVLAVDWIGAGRSSEIPGKSPWLNAMRFDGDVRDSWQYHNLRALWQAKEFLLSQPDTDPEQLMCLGGSWGGFYSWLLAGLDDRIKYIFPTFGCGFLDTEARGVWESYFISMGPEKAEQWRRAFDPGRRVHRMKAKVFYQQATNDRFYTMVASMETYRRVQTEKRLVMVYNQDHLTEPYHGQDTAMVRGVLDGRESEVMPEMRSVRWIPDTNLVEIDVRNPVEEQLRVSVVYSAGSYTKSFARYWREVLAEERDGRLVAEIPIVDPTREIWFYGHAVAPPPSSAERRGAFPPARLLPRGASTPIERVVPAQIGFSQSTAEFDPSFDFGSDEYYNLPVGDRHFPAMRVLEDGGRTALAMRFGRDPNRRGVAFCLEGDVIASQGYDGIEVSVRVPAAEDLSGLKLCIVTDFNALAEQDYVVDLDQLDLDFTGWQTLRLPFAEFWPIMHRRYDFYQPPLEPLDVSRLCAVGFYHSSLDYAGEALLADIEVIRIEDRGQTKIPPRPEPAKPATPAKPAKPAPDPNEPGPYDFVVETALTPDELRDQLKQWEPWRFRVFFSNGVRTTDLATFKPFVDRPAGQWRVFENEIPDAALRGGKALDVGSNIGHMAHYLRGRYGMEVLGVERSQRNLEVANFLVETAGLDGIEFVDEDANSFMSTERFDLIVHLATLDNLKDPFRALENAGTMLAPGGYLALATQIYKDPSGDETLCKFIPHAPDAPFGIWWSLGKDAVLNMLEHAGFVDVQVLLEWAAPEQIGETERKLNLLARKPAG